MIHDETHAMQDSKPRLQREERSAFDEVHFDKDRQGVHSDEERKGVHSDEDRQGVYSDEVCGGLVRGGAGSREEAPGSVSRALRCPGRAATLPAGRGAVGKGKGTGEGGGSWHERRNGNGAFWKGENLSKKYIQREVLRRQTQCNQKKKSSLFT